MTKFFLSFLFAASVYLISCSDDYMSMNASNAAQGDVIIKASKQGNSTKYAIVYYAYSSIEMAKVSAYYDDSPTHFELDTIGGRFTFALFPSTSDYTDSLPKSGNYWFELEFTNGTKSLTSDYLSNEVIEPPIVENITFNDLNDRMTINWSADSKAYNYKVMLVDNLKNIVYESNLLPSSQNSIVIGLSSKEWYSNSVAKNSDSMRVVLQSYLFEDRMSLLDVQCISVNDQTKLRWGK